MDICEIKENEIKISLDEFNEISNLGEFLRWAHDQYLPIWLSYNLEEEIFEAASTYDIDEEIIMDYCEDPKVWEYFGGEDSICYADKWFSELIGEEYTFYKYSFRRPHDSFANALTEIIEQFTKFKGHAANDIANDYEQYYDFDHIEFSKDKVNQANSILDSWLPDQD